MPQCQARAKVLLVLRALALGVLVLILLNPVRVNTTQYRGPEPAAIFLIDESRSMSLEKPVSRAQAVDRLIRGAEASIPAQSRPAIQTFGFGRDLVARAEHAAARSPTADVTRLAWALEQLPTRFGDRLPFAVFVFSDGRSTDPDSLDPMARAFRRWACRSMSCRSETHESPATWPSRTSTHREMPRRGRACRSG